MLNTNNEPSSLTFLSDYNIFFFGTKTSSNDYAYYGKFLSFSIGNNINPKYNPDEHYAFFYERNEIMQCNEMCLTCLSQGNATNGGCTSCGKTNYMYPFLENRECLSKCPDGYIGLENYTCFLFVPQANATEEKTAVPK